MPSLTRPKMLNLRNTKPDRIKRTATKDLRASRINVVTTKILLTVANTNVGYQRQKQGGGNYRKSEGGGFRPNSFEAAMQGHCPSHSKLGRPANHTWEQCN